MRENFSNLLKQRILVGDGAMGTMLQASGMPAGHCSEEWNISHPQVISDIHRKYLAAGADIIETNSFGGNRYRLGFHGFSDSVSLFNQKAAEIACSVCPTDKFVAGSVGPTGEFLQPVGTLTIEQMTAAFREQIEALCSAGVNLIIVETMSDIDEACAAIRGAKSVDPKIPVIATMTFEKKPTGYRTMMGFQPVDMIDKFRDAGAEVIGANCGTGMTDMIEIIKQLRENTDFPLMTQANAGLPETKGGQIQYKESPEDRGEAVRKILSAGVNIIGGCCGTNPAHIKATYQAVVEYSGLK